MAISAEFVAWLEERFSAVSGASVRKMFGGVGVFRRGLMFALATAEGRVALKADEGNVAAFKAEGMEEWTYPGRNGKPMSMGYWYAPERLFDDEDELKAWSMAAFDAALRADARKPKGQRKLKG
jgi:DNA transformation protein